MAGIDSLLRMLLDNGADELRLASDEPPRMRKRGAPVRLAIPPTPDDILRHLLGPLWGDEQEAALRESGKVEGRHTLGSESFAVTLLKKGAGIEIVFRRGAAPSGAGAPVRPSPFTSPPPVPPASVPSIPPPPGALPPVPPSSVLPPVPPPSVPPSSPPASGFEPLEPATPPPMAPPLEPIAQDVSDQPIYAGLPQAQLVPELATLLGHAVSLGASDVHLAAGEPPSVRIDGRLRRLDGHPPADPERWLAGIADAAAIVRARAGRSVDIAFGAPGLGRFRLNLYRADNRLAAAVRILPGRVPSLMELNLPASLEELITAPHGLIVVCGPTGSGKSATLAALAQAAMRRRPGLTITLEDPVEYALEAAPGALVRQRQIGRDVSDFHTGLRDALREDPDVLLIGEMRDAESISLAITAAETGHLVLTSLHSRSAPSSIERMIDSYPPERQQQIRVQLADALRAVVAQRLVPRARGTGRLPVVEVLRMSHAVGSLVREGRTEQLFSALQSGKKEGMVALERSLADLVRGNQITREHAFAVANDATALTMYLNG